MFGLEFKNFTKMKSNFVLLIFCILFCIFVTDCIGDNVKKSVAEDNRDDNGETNDDNKDDAVIDSMEVPAEVEPNNVTCTRRQNNQMHEIRAAQHKQFPFMVAVMSDHHEYVCAGTVVSNGLILTTAQCILQPISYVLLNSTKAKRDETTVALHIIKTEKFPTFPTSDTDKDVGLIYTEKHNNSIAGKIKLSNYTSTRNVLDVEVIGFGLNSDVGQIKELQYIGLEKRDYPILSVDSRELIRGYFDCIDTKVLTCFKDTGGPSIFDNELVGIVIKGQSDCIKEMTSAYAVNKRIAEILPTYTFKAWLDERIKKNEEQEKVALATFPMKPTRREQMHQLTSSGYKPLPAAFYEFVGLIFFKVWIL